MPEETPVLDALAAITAVSIVGSELPAREHVIARLAALIAVDAPTASYLLNAGTAVEVGITLEDVQSLLVAVAPIVGTPRVVSASAKIAQALGLAVALIEEEIEEELEDAADED